MTQTDAHTCSYFCDRPACVRAQRDELRDRLAAVSSEASCESPVAPAAALTERHESEPGDKNEQPLPQGLQDASLGACAADPRDEELARMRYALSQLLPAGQCYTTPDGGCVGHGCIHDAGCPNAGHMAEHACTNASQCWEPCGELGKSEEHAVPAPPRDAAFRQLRDVQKLRERTRVGFGDARHALAACFGDIEMAEEWLRRRGTSNPMLLPVPTKPEQVEYQARRFCEFRGEDPETPVRYGSQTMPLWRAAARKILKWIQTQRACDL